MRLEQTPSVFIRGSIRLGILVLAFLCWFALRVQTTLLPPVLPLALVGTKFKYLLAPYSRCG